MYAPREWPTMVTLDTLYFDMAVFTAARTLDAVLEEMRKLAREEGDKIRRRTSLGCPRSRCGRGY